MAPAVVSKLMHRLSHSHSNGERESRMGSLAHEQERQQLVDWERVKEPLEPEQVMVDPQKKPVGHSSKYLRRDDFNLIKTLGTGTFARVWLVKLNDKKGSEKCDKVFALKILRKADVVRLKQVEHVRNERNILAKVAGHPFITTMVTSFQDPETLYMLLDYCPGGEVFSYLRRAKRFNEPTARFYAAEVVLIFEFLHEKEGIAYRDLKPENILIDAEGHLKLVDFGFAKRINRETYTLCGTPEYLAPEVIRNTGHGTSVDWWALGILIYEFLVGQPPFWDQNPMKIYEQIVQGKLRFPSAMPELARDIISQLCQADVSKRLGNVKGGAGTVRSHPWFEGIDWDALYHRQMQGPIVPHLTGPDDTRNFDEYAPEPTPKDHYTKVRFTHCMGKLANGAQEMQAKYESMFADF
ncbi:serine/threonine-protein kinase YPK2/YKR2 [Piedraia hortae CBS 480.64]|uniref:cAMP-dependent protein kinase n=1 Tax=Piedraia hortae CBS 480.64 TaxID=1314780 RepID=A0A6A7BZM2_9PEZI|nr:serine/threonine-protein kinase YPK2/YKR2 [Piedraia hortae CBS 480.64]